MKSLFKQIFTYMVVISFLPVHAEDNKLYTDPRVQISLPSTEAQALGKISEIPVDLYTGRTNINIPLFTIKHNDIEVPISLSYHGGGIKVDDEAGIVGLGWTLNAGGVVSRIVRGLPDDLYDYNGPVKGFDYLGTSEQAFISALKRTNPSSSLVILNHIDSLQLMSEYGELYDENKIDVSPDNYIFSFQGFSGAFVGKTPTNVQTNGGCSVGYNINGNAYHISTVDGLRYIFSKHEQRIFPYRITDIYNTNDWYQLPEYTHKYVSAWWLSSIHSAAGDSITFAYETSKHIPPRPNFYSYTQFLTKDEYQQDQYVSTNYNSYTHPFVSVGKDTLYHQQLSSIKTPYCRLEFKYGPLTSNSRIRRLDTISLYSTIGTEEELIERYIFSYAGLHVAAKLYQLTHEGKNQVKEYYNFTYYSMNAKGIGSDNKDHWGFFSQYSSGRFPNKTYFAKTNSNILPITPSRLSPTIVSERHADNENASNNMLESISYPSGLVTKFTWEPHTFSRLSNVGYEAYQFNKEYDYLEVPGTTYEKINKDKFTLCGKENNEILIAQKYLSTNQFIDIDISSYFYNHEVWNIMDCVMDWRENYMASDRPVFCIEYEGQEILHVHLDSASIQSMQNHHLNYIAVKDYGAGMYTFTLKNPRTTLVSPHTNCCVQYHEMFNKPETSLGTIFISIVEQRVVNNPYNARNVGGVRIKKIEYKEGTNTLLSKEYSYLDSTRLSSGVLSFSPRYASTYPIITTGTFNQYVGGTGMVCSNLLVLRSNGLPYVLNGGNHIEYQHVTEHTVLQEGQSSGIINPINRVDYYYCTAIDTNCSDIDDTHATIYIPTDQLQLTSRKHQRGHLTKMVEYTDEIKTTTYGYQILESVNNKFFTGSAFVTADFQALSYGYEGVRPYKNYGITKYRVIPYNKRLINQKTVGEKTNTYHAYTYANNTYVSSVNANLPLTHSYVTSEGDTLIEHYSYYRETNLIDSYLITKNGYVVDGYNLDYDEAHRVIKKYKPKLCPTSLPSINTVEWDTLETYLYDPEKSKITLIINHKTNVRTIYVWSYKGQYPIAEINSAEPINLVDLLGGALEMKNLRDSSQPDISIVDNLRGRLPNATIKTMTYEPFVGITSYTDEKGYTLYYKYDDFRRLQEIYEIVGDTVHVLKHIDYQMKNY